MDGTPINHLAKVQQLAEEYASYSRSKGGLANVLGGIAGLVIYLLNGLLGRSIWTTVLTLTLTAGWLCGKELFRVYLYRPFGQAREMLPQDGRNCSLWIGRFFILLALFLCFVFGWGYVFGKISLIQLLIGLAVVALIPWIARRYLHTNDEISVGVYLLVSCALVSVGSLLGEGMSAWMIAGWMPLYAVMLLWRGINEHRQFLHLARQLQDHGASY